VWTFDNEFKPLWTYRGNPGHYPWPYDFNGDGKEEFMCGFDLLAADGTKVWSLQNVAGNEHADCLQIGDVNGDGQPEIIFGGPTDARGGVTIATDRNGKEIWRNADMKESQQVVLGKFRKDLPGLQVFGLDRVDRGRVTPRDALFLIGSDGKTIWKETANTNGWGTAIHKVINWDGKHTAMVLAHKRGRAIMPKLYDGKGKVISTFPTEGNAMISDLTGEGREQIVMFDQAKAHVYANGPCNLSKSPSAGKPVPQPKALYNFTRYGSGEITAAEIKAESSGK